MALWAAPGLRAQSAGQLRDDVERLTSARLNGRATPSTGLETAADYIDSRFRATGLETSFQTVELGRGQKARNVVGLLRGSGIALAEQYVVLSAHYDHLGHGFPGANDDASGVASLFAVAESLLKGERPLRSVLFVAFAGEERGLLGSRYYVAHPMFPLEATVAAINLEQLGRTDDLAGARIRSFAMTGTRFSDLPELITEAAGSAGISVYRRPDEERFFDRGDNFPFSTKGVVSTTIVVAFDFPDYHKRGDKAEKLDYDNLEALDRGIAAAVRGVADGPRPHWVERAPSRR